MITTSLFVIANVKLLRTDVRFRILPVFFRISRGVSVLNSTIFNIFYIRFVFGTILEGLRVWNPQTPSLGTLLAIREVIFTVLFPEVFLQYLVMLAETKLVYLAMHSTIDRCWTEQSLL